MTRRYAKTNYDGDTDPVSTASPDNFVDVGDITLVVNDGGCSVRKNGYEACTTCTTCTTAAGANEPNTHGIGERCETSRNCATGLTCGSGICTRSCSSDSDCYARAEDCRIKFQFANVCATIGGSRQCTTSCGFGDDNKCTFDYGRSATCTNQQCIP